MLAPRDRHLFGIKVRPDCGIMQRAMSELLLREAQRWKPLIFGCVRADLQSCLATYLAGRLLVKVKYLGMPNVLADKQVVREFIQHRARPKDLAKALAQLLDNPMARERMNFRIREDCSAAANRRERARGKSDFIRDLFMTETVRDVSTSPDMTEACWTINERSGARRSCSFVSMTTSMATRRLRPGQNKRDIVRNGDRRTLVLPAHV